MKIINERYKIVELLNQNRTYSVYEAIDINNDMAMVNIYILNNSNIENKFIDFCIYEYENIPIMKNDALKILDFGVVNSIENKDNKDNYYYTTETHNNYRLLLDAVGGISEETLIKIFLEICVVAYNQSYNYIKIIPFNEENMYVSLDLKVKLKDKLTALIQSREIGIGTHLEDIEELIEGSSNKFNEEGYYINRLSEILINMVLKNKDRYRDSKTCKIIIKYIENNEGKEYEELFGVRLYNLIEKLCNNKNNSINNIYDIIEQVNSIYNMNYKYKGNGKEKELNFNIPLIGRNEEIKMIIGSINRIVKYHETKNVILVHGEIGIGKTRLLEHIKYIMSIRENKGIKCFYMKSSKEEHSNATIGQLLRKIVSIADKNLISKYKKEIMILVPDIYGDNHEENQGYSRLNNKEKLILIAKISSFLQEYYHDNPGIIIIDDMNMYDALTLNVIHYILNKSSSASNILIIIGYRDGDCLNNNNFTDFIDFIKDKIALNVHLRSLTEKNSAKMLRNILNIEKISDEFIDTFYKYSMGNPLFIEESLKDLCNRKIIYINEEDGKWHKPKDHDMYMPINMEKICESQLKGVDNLSYDILYIMSFFYTPMPVKVLKDVLRINKHYIDDIVEELVAKGILYSSIGDNGFVYAFYNKFLRSYLYKDVESSIKEDVHKKIVIVLEMYCYEELNIYIEEIIYHLEILGSSRKLIYYYQKNEERLEHTNSVNEAIRYNFKILEIIDKFENRNEFIQDEINANINLGKLYNTLSEKSVAIEYYIKAQKLCKSQELLVTSIDIMVEMIWIYTDLGNDREIEFYTNEIYKMLENLDYITGTIKYLRIITRDLYNNGKYDELKEVCNRGITLCREGHMDYKVGFYNSYCNALIAESKEEEALNILKETVKECYEKNYTKALPRIYNSIGVIYSDYIQCGEEALSWFKKLNEVANLEENKYFEVTALSNIGFSNYVLVNYDEAYKYLNQASNMATQNELIYMNFYSYVYIASTLYKQGRYSECFRYVDMCNNYIENNSIFGQELAPYCILSYYTKSLIGQSREAIEHLLEGKKAFDNTNSVIKYKIELLCVINSMLLEGELKDIGNIIEASEKILYVDLRVSMLCDAILQLLNRDLNEIAIEIYNYVKKFQYQVKSNLNKLTLIYIEATIYKCKSKDILEEALHLYKGIKNPNLMWKIYSKIGYDYYENGDKANAAIYISEACDMILDILLQIPKNHRKSFLQNQRTMVSCFEVLLQIKSYYNQGKGLKLATIDVNIIEDIEDLFQIIVESDFINDEFIKSLKDSSQDYLRNIDSIEDLLNNLCGNSQESMGIICKYISYISLSTKTSVIIENNNKFYVVASNDDISELPEDMSIVNIARNKGMPIRLSRKLINDANGNILSYDIENNIKAAMCIPITQISRASRGMSKYDYNHDVLGYIYVESNRKLNNINENTMGKCVTIGRILYMIIDKFNIKRNSTIDKLTKTLTRKYLESFIHEQIDRSFNLNSEFSTIMVDIDKFKAINDTFGHRMGDQVLSKICEVIIKNIRQDDAIGRYGGEEFIIVLPNTGIEEARSIAERIRVKIYEAKVMGDKRQVTVSLGVANYPNHTTTYEELIEKTDQALYAAKNSGRNATRVWNESYGSKISTTNKLSGIFVGNENQDYKNVSTLIEFIDLIDEDGNIDEKIATIINRIREITEADLCTLIILKDGNLVNRYSKAAEQFNNEVDKMLNYDRIISAINFGENICGVDWDYLEEYDEIKNIPDLKSNMVVLLRSRTDIIGAICLTASINHKEFTYDELNFVNTLGKVIVPILKEQG
jgi:diguanylate cyclase (GGDEF)-like protein